MNNIAPPFDRKPAKRRTRAIALRCVQACGPWVYGDRYLAIAGHRPTPGCTFFVIMLDGEQRTVSDFYFVPCNPVNWPLFGQRQRLRFAPETIGAAA